MCRCWLLGGGLLLSASIQAFNMPSNRPFSGSARREWIGRACGLSTDCTDPLGSVQESCPERWFTPSTASYCGLCGGEVALQKQVEGPRTSYRGADALQSPGTLPGLHVPPGRLHLSWRDWRCGAGLLLALHPRLQAWGSRLALGLFTTYLLWCRSVSTSTASCALSAESTRKSPDVRGFKALSFAC